MQTTRTFVAVVVPEALGSKLTRLQSLLAPGVTDVRWYTASPFHITLAFLGDVDNPELNDVCRAVAEASRESPPFDLRIEGLGVFPNPEKARTLWAGLTGPGLAPLVDLQRGVAAACAGAGYPHDDQHFRPHITLGRITRGRRPPPDLAPLLAHYRAWSAGSFPVTEVVTFASTLTREGPEYAPLARAPLNGRKGKTTT
jgi:2'-5' RNA ligase